MATAHMQGRTYQPIYHTPQSNSPASVASPQTHDQHGRSMYGQPPPPLSAPMYGYPQYSPLSQVHSSPYGHPQQPQHPQLTSQPMLMQPTGPPQMSHPQVPGHSSGMTSSPRMKLESSQQHNQHNQHNQQPPARLPMTQPQSTPSLPTGPVKMDYNSRPEQQPHNNNAGSAPGPIPATTPLVVRQDNGVQWIAFEYSRDRVKLEYTIRCDVESVNIDDLSPEFKSENCVYPRACCRKEDYKGNRLNYETECNAVGWALAELNQSLRGKRGLIQRAVDSWRNSNQDVRLRSRRVRRQAKMTNKRGPVHSGPIGGSNMPGNAGIPGPNTGMTAPNARAPGSMPMTAPPLHHHHSNGTDSRSDDVSGNPEYPSSTQAHRQAPPPHQVPLQTDLRYSQHFHGYTPYPPAPSGDPSMPPPMHHAMDSLGRPVGTAAVVSAEKADTEDEDQRNMFGDLPDGKRRKFILVEDQENNKRVRVKVMLEQVNMKEIPDSYRKNNSVFPRSYTATEMDVEPGTGRGGRFFSEEGGADDNDEVVSRTLVPVPLPDGEGELAVPRIPRSMQRKESVLNEIGYRMSWSQSRTFHSRHLFLQRSLDAYRTKMKSTMITNGQEESGVLPHFEVRPGKRRWQEFGKKDSREASPPAAPSS